MSSLHRITLATIAALSIAGYAYGRRVAHGARPAHAAPPPDESALVAEPPPAPLLAPFVSPSPLPAPVAVAPIPAAPREPPARRVVETELDVADRAEAAFVSEGVDRAWAVDTERHLGGAFRALAPSDASILSIECRDSLCRVETRHPNLESYGTFSLAAFPTSDEPTWTGATFAHVAERGTRGDVRVVTYLVRPGRAAPYAE